VSVQNNPFAILKLQPWTEDATVLASSNGSSPGKASDGSLDGHLNWLFQSPEAEVQLMMDFATAKWDGSMWDGSLEAQGRAVKVRNYTACDPMGGVGPTHCVGSPAGNGAFRG